MYQEFNDLIYDHFFKREEIGNTITLSIDEEIITDIASQMGHSIDQLLKSITDYLKDDWEKTLNSDVTGIPQYLGLIVVQVYAAHLMQKKKDGEYTEKAYLTHLNQLFGFDRNNQVEKLFDKYQEKIWDSFKDWTLERGFYIQLPGHKEGKCRYVQYPLSQALLNKEDLTRVPILFQEAEIMPGEDFSLEDFTDAIFPVQNGKVTPHFYRVYKKYQDGVQRQVFKYYQQWDGTIPEAFQRDKIPISRHWEKNTDELILERRHSNSDDNSFDLFIVDRYSKKTEKFSLMDANLFFEIRKSYRLHENLIAFTQDVDYGDWIAARYLQCRISCMILGKKGHPASIPLMNEFRKIALNDYSSRFHHLFELLVDDLTDVPELLKKYFSKSKKRITLQNGLKLGRKIWMDGAGPDILIEGENIRWWLNGEKIENNRFSCRNLPVGEHTIKIPGNTQVKFFLEMPKEEIPNLERGWKVSKNPPLWNTASETPLIKGLILADVDKKEDVSIIHQWSEALMRIGDKRQIPSSPVVVNTIRRKYYGIR